MTPAPAADTVTLTVVHAAPRPLVFAALTSPEHLTHFWGPAGTTTPVEGIVVDLRPGGAFETTMVADDGSGSFTMRAVYVDVDPPRLLSWRETGSGLRTELVLTDLGDGRTEVRTTQSGLPPAMRTPEARAGWRTALDRFAGYVAALVADRAGPAGAPVPTPPEESR